MATAPVIALSYRREESVAIAGRLYDRLQSTFGRQNVFMDFDSIPAGSDFREHIFGAIERSDIVIALIGPNWLGEKGASRRIDDPNDFVRLEVSFALARGIPIIPVLINQAEMPQADQLPLELRELAFRNALPLDGGRDFDSHTERVIRAVRAISVSDGRVRRTGWRPTARVTIALIAAFTALVIGVGLNRLRTSNRNTTVNRESNQTNETPPPVAATPGRVPESSPSLVASRDVPAPSSPTPQQSAPALSLKDFRGAWVSVSSNPVAGDATITVHDELRIEEKTINETITTKWVAKGDLIFKISLQIRFVELWVYDNQLNARCAAADVTEVFDPKEFGKYANIAEQTRNASKAGVGLVYAFTQSGTELRRGGTVWSRQKQADGSVFKPGK